MGNSRANHKPPDERVWFPLDGTYHSSVHVRMSALHLATPGYAAQCDRRKLLYKDDGYTQAEAEKSGRKFCALCLKIKGQPDES